MPPADWTIPGDHEVNKNFGAELDLSSSHHDFKAKLFVAILEMRDSGTGKWLGPKVTIKTNTEGTVITKFDGTTLSFPAFDFDHAGVQALVDKAKIVTFVSNNVPDPR